MGGARVAVRSTPAGAPPLAGRVEQVGPDSNPFELLLLDQPAPGAALLGANKMGDQTCLVMSFYLYGDRAAAAAAQVEPLWRVWLDARFPSAKEAEGAV